MGKSKNKKKIKKPTIPQSEIPKQKLPIKSSDGFIFSTIYHNWIKGTDQYYKNNNFTNMVSDVNEFSRNMTEIITEIIPKLYEDWENLFNIGNMKYSHCHPVAAEKKDLVKNISETIHGIEFNNDDLSQSRVQWWYIGLKNNVRLVGLFQIEEKTFFPMFIDHHHLIHENKNYNQSDYKKYNYCPINDYKS